MMNDGFAAQLRQHLARTANDLPADGQLAAVVQAVSGTAQSRPLAARLRWNPGRTGPFPLVQLRYALVVLALLAATLASALIIAGGPSRSTVFEGTWTSVDPGDGSTQYLVVAAGTSPAVQFVDEFATGAACPGDAVKVFTADGRGTVVADDQLEVEWPDGGGCGLLTADMGPGKYTYDQATDTLVDDLSLTWTRADGKDAPPTRPPAPERTSYIEGCIRFDRPSSYTAVAGSLTLTVDAPATPESIWHGLRERFYLVNAPCLFGGDRLEASIVNVVYPDGCYRAGAGVEVDRPADAIAAVAALEGVEAAGRTDVTLGGYTGSRFDITVPPDYVATACNDGAVVVFDGITNLDAGTIELYVVDVEGTTLAIAIFGNEGGDPAVAAEIDGILASLEIER